MKLTDYTVQTTDGKSQCPICNKWFAFRGLPSHFHRTHNPNAKLPSHTTPIWNKGKTKDSDSRVKKLSEKVSTSTKGLIKSPLTKEQKEKISIALKRAHQEGRHLGWHHKNADPERRTYPEKWFRKVIQNDTDLSMCQVIEQLRVGKYLLDFAFPEFMVVLEVDGEHHKRPEVQIKDKIRDEYLISKGWNVYRIEWKTMFENTIQKISDFKEYLFSKSNTMPHKSIEADTTL